jgi:hypothetical protein
MDIAGSHRMRMSCGFVREALALRIRAKVASM